MKLTEMKYDAFAKLAREIDDRIDRAANLYNQLLKEADVPLHDKTMLHNGKVYLDDLDSGIDISWDTSWAYGGHDSGDSYFSMKNLLDDTWEESITIRAKKVIREHRKEISAEKRRKKSAERAEYNKLKKKFEGKK